ncbi:HAMP domain-containing protein [Streptomyces adustus]|uniref:histidine kinase n=1 Tax=Streptomyces adustus TaxID=1609272 RepID=A0A5N8VDC1_9ACTN|nr:ATP-binding protein [Streptomyces adustus]MPY33257.1 HAMP domain-containing protein [Streptomyces adustus]
MAGWTTRHWLRRGVAATLLVLAVLGSVGAWAMLRSSRISDELVNRRSPALVNAVRLESALLNQETGVRGYGLTGRREFLTPYTEGVAAERQAVGRLEEVLRGGDDLADLAAVRKAAGTWQERIARPVSGSSAPAALTLSAQRAEEGKTEFDAVRKALKDQQSRLQQERQNAAAALRRATVLRNWTLAVDAFVVAVVAALVFEALRRGITRPLEQVGAGARDVARGRFDRRIAVTGPADIRQLAVDVDGMRTRLVDELAFSEEARRLLDEQTAELKRSNTELEQFAYVASHDLQEPLRKVSSFTQLLQRRYGGQLDERADQYIAFAVDGANRMQVLINDLLAFSRVGRVHNDHATVDLDEVLRRTLDTLSIPIEETDAEVTFDPLPVVVGDATQLGMLWQNLLSNSLKFRDPGRRPEIRVSARRDGDVWEFGVGDNGIGIAPEFRDKVFVIFQRLHTREAYPGTGIGLAMCKKVVEFHDGSIGIDPDHSPGTRVVFTLPCADVAQEPESSGSSESPESSESLARESLS